MRPPAEPPRRPPVPAPERTLAEVQPLALDAVMALFTVAMEAKIEEGIAQEVERELGRRDRR